MSLPSWECGLKLLLLLECTYTAESLPSWECGLKLQSHILFLLAYKVTPFVGVWIEILPDTTPLSLIAGHSLRGSVD